MIALTSKIKRTLFIVVLSLINFQAYAVCLSNLQSKSTDERFVVVDGSLIVDQETGLMWKRCAEGFDWQNGECQENGDAHLFNWQESLIASQQTYQNYSDWRMPNKNELDSIVDRSCAEPAINENIFPNTPVENFWTNTPNAFNSEFAWAITFSEGAHISTRRSNMFAVRLVRSY